MADLLIMLNPGTEGDRRGEILDVKPTGQLAPQTWPGSPFFVLRLTDVDEDQVRRYMGPWNTEDGLDEKGNPKYRRIARKLWKLRDDLVPAAIRQQIAVERIYETTWAAVKQFVRNKLTGGEAD